MILAHNYHDAELAGVEYSREKASLLLAFDCVGEGVGKISCTGIRNFRLGEFGLQNVVSRLMVSTSRTFAAEDIRAHVDWANSKDDVRRSMTDERARFFVDGISNGQLVLLVLEPSVGAELVVVCERVEELQ
ncbi:hypothetical protein [Caballeronia humi]|jgi:hypothetical protein|uniref:Uncharacterized protein n=1 Tax=Caballeronia humi TaxID=326474 RepID=A0A158HN88_9BURK|nr:hypothetical protein [Caballeronia humi]SAL45825.1 hypothetical protein AWB65_03604 [Caballeronia humi]